MVRGIVVDELPGTAVPRKVHYDRCRARARGHDPEGRPHPRAHHRDRLLRTRDGDRSARSRVWTSSSWRRPAMSAARGGTTPTRARRAMCRRICTRSPSSRNPIGRMSSRTSRTSRTISRASPTSTALKPLHSLRPHVDRAHWDDSEYRWHVFTKSGQEYVAQFVISGAGAFHIPSLPDIEGQRIPRPVFPFRPVGPHRRPHRQAGRGHRNRRECDPDRSRDRQGRRRLQLYQRTPPWIKPRPN